MSDTLALASRLQRESDEALAALLTSRHLAKRDLRDFFDLADALLQPDSIQDALSHLDRPTLAALAGATTTPIAAGTLSPGLTGALAGMLLYEAHGAVQPYDAVSAVLDSWPARGLPDAALLATVPAPGAEAAAPTAGAAPTGTTATTDTAAPNGRPDNDRVHEQSHGREAADRLSGERVFETTVAVTELVISLTSTPARELAKGGLAVPDSKRLAAATGREPDEMNTIIHLAQLAALVVRDGSTWYVSEYAAEWLLLPLAERWGALAEAWLRSLPETTLDVLRLRADSGWGESLGEFIDWLYPAGGAAQLAEVQAVVRDAELLGIAALGTVSAAGHALLGTPAGVADAAVALVAANLPAEVSTVYVQHDLTIVAPGPLAPRLDATLRAMAQIETHSIASTYRISAGSIAKALSAGYTAASIRAFLTEISSTGIPQPLEYLIAESSSRYGLLRAGEVAAEPGELATSYVRSDDRELLHTIAVDQNLGSLGLVFVNGNRLVSRFGLDTVYWMLVDARYPVIAETDSGRPQTLTRVKPSGAPPAQATATVGELINRLRGSGVQGGEHTAEAWLVRQLDAAVKNKTPVVVTVRLPNGSELSIPMVPTSVASGRMRGTDQKAGVERTVPLSSITTVVAAAPVA